jgi:hypothetical protein
MNLSPRNLLRSQASTPGERVDSIVTTFLSGAALSSRGTRLSVEIAVRRAAGRCSTRSGFAVAVKSPCRRSVVLGLPGCQKRGRADQVGVPVSVRPLGICSRRLD